MDFEQIKELIKIVNDSDLKSFSLNIDGANISMSKNDGMFNENIPVIENKTLSVSEAVTETVHQTAESGNEIKGGNIIYSPIVGTFYASAKPSSPAMKSRGDKVKKGEAVCIIEAMKIMNEITSEFDGIVDEVFVENEQIVEFGQPLFRII